jgi:hypothetical protein
MEVQTIAIRGTYEELVDATEDLIGILSELTPCSISRQP